MQFAFAASDNAVKSLPDATETFLELEGCWKVAKSTALRSYE